MDFQNTGTFIGSVFTNQETKLNAVNAAALNAAMVLGQLATSPAFAGINSITTSSASAADSAGCTCNTPARRTA